MLTSKLSPQKLLQSLPKHRERGIGVEHLIQALGFSRSEVSGIRGLLTEFVRVGLVAAKGGRYWRKHAPGVLIGTLRGTRSGHSFVLPEDPVERDKGDLFINARSMGSALHGDTVIAHVTGADKRGREGRIEAVLHRANKTIIGKFLKLKIENIVSPIDEKFLYEINIARSDTLNASDGDIVNVEITRPPNAGRRPAGRVIEVLGRPETPGLDIEIIVRKHHLPYVFSEAAIAEAEHIGGEVAEQDFANRVDLRGLTTLTIDGETARDFDDAVSLEQLANGRLRLGVHIADVS